MCGVGLLLHMVMVSYLRAAELKTLLRTSTNETPLWPIGFILPMTQRLCLSLASFLLQNICAKNWQRQITDHKSKSRHETHGHSEGRASDRGDDTSDHNKSNGRNHEYEHDQRGFQLLLHGKRDRAHERHNHSPTPLTGRPSVMVSSFSSFTP